MRGLIAQLSFLSVAIGSLPARGHRFSGGRALDACAIVPSADVSTMLGRPAGRGVGATGPEVMNSVQHPIPSAVYAMCGYNASAALVTAQVAMYPSAAAARQGFQAMQADEQHSTEPGHTYAPDVDGNGFAAGVSGNMRSYTAIMGVRSIQLIVISTDGAPVAFDKLKAVVQAALGR